MECGVGYSVKGNLKLYMILHAWKNQSRGTILNKQKSHMLIIYAGRKEKLEQTNANVSVIMLLSSYDVYY